MSSIAAAEGMKVCLSALCEARNGAPGSLAAEGTKGRNRGWNLSGNAHCRSSRHGDSATASQIQEHIIDGKKNLERCLINQGQVCKNPEVDTVPSDPNTGRMPLLGCRVKHRRFRIRGVFFSWWKTTQKSRFPG